MNNQELNVVTFLSLRQEEQAEGRKQLANFLVTANREAFAAARRAGLSHEEAEDLASDTVLLFLERLRADSFVELTAHDIRGSEALVKKLKAGKSALAKYLYESLSPDIRGRVDRCDGAHPPDTNLESSLAQELNRIMIHNSLNEHTDNSAVEIQEENSCDNSRFKRNLRLLSNEFRTEISLTHKEYAPHTQALPIFMGIAKRMILHQSDSRNKSDAENSIVSLNAPLEKDKKKDQDESDTLEKAIRCRLPDPEPVAIWKDSVERCQQQLTDEQLCYLNLHLQHFTHIEIAHMLGVSQTQIRAMGGRLMRTVTKFKLCLQKQGITRRDVIFL